MTAAPAGSHRSDYRCASCGYGVVAIDTLPTCPMCGGSTWDPAEWRPFTRTRADSETVQLPAPLPEERAKRSFSTG